MTIRVHFKNGNMPSITLRDKLTLEVLAQTGAVHFYEVRQNRKLVTREFEGNDGFRFNF